MVFAINQGVFFFMTGGMYQPVGTRKLNGTLDQTPDAFLIKLQPKDADVFIGYPTTEGQVSTMDAQIGSTFFQELAQCIRDNYKNKCLDKMFTMVTNVVAKEKCHLDDFGEYMHTPQKVSTRRQSLFFKKDPLIRVRNAQLKNSPSYS